MGLGEAGKVQRLFASPVPSVGRSGHALVGKTAEQDRHHTRNKEKSDVVAGHTGHNRMACCLLFAMPCTRWGLVVAARVRACGTEDVATSGIPSSSVGSGGGGELMNADKSNRGLSPALSLLFSAAERRWPLSAVGSPKRPILSWRGTFFRPQRLTISGVSLAPCLPFGRLGVLWYVVWHMGVFIYTSLFVLCCMYSCLRSKKMCARFSMIYSFFVFIFVSSFEMVCCLPTPPPLLVFDTGDPTNLTR